MMELFLPILGVILQTTTEQQKYKVLFRYQSNQTLSEV